MGNIAHDICKNGHPRTEINIFQRKDGRRECRDCIRVVHRRASKKYYLKDAGKQQRKYWLKNKERYNGWRLQREYSITQEEYYQLVEKQNGFCAACGRDPHTLERLGRQRQQQQLHIDHNHITGKVRGLLCRECNLALGLLRDDISTLVQLIRYLKGDRN